MCRAIRLRRDGDIHHIAFAGSFADTKAADLQKLPTLNATVPTLLASAVVSGMVKRGTGTIINIGSVVGFVVSAAISAPMRTPASISSTLPLLKHHEASDPSFD